MVCSVEMAAGIVFDRDSGRWTAAAVKPRAKYVLRESTRSKFKYEVAQLGSKTASAFCEKNYDRGYLRCVGLGSEFYFSRTDMRFIMTYSLGYWNETSSNEAIPDRREGDDTPHIEAGTCADL